MTVTFQLPLQLLTHQYSCTLVYFIINNSGKKQM